MGMGSNEERLEHFRAALHGQLAGALEVHDVTPEGAAMLFLTVVTAARQVFFGHDAEKAFDEETTRMLLRGQSKN